MSCCNHFRDFLVLSSADLTRLTLVDLDFVPAPGCQQKNKISPFLQRIWLKFQIQWLGGESVLSAPFLIQIKIKTQHKQESHAQCCWTSSKGGAFSFFFFLLLLPVRCHTLTLLVVILPDDGQKGDEHFFPSAASSSCTDDKERNTLFSVVSFCRRRRFLLRPLTAENFFSSCSNRVRVLPSNTKKKTLLVTEKSHRGQSQAQNRVLFLFLLIPPEWAAFPQISRRKGKNFPQLFADVL